MRIKETIYQSIYNPMTDKMKGIIQIKLEHDDLFGIGVSIETNDLGEIIVNSKFVPKNINDLYKDEFK